MQEIVELMAGLPAWMLAHPWAFAGWAVLMLTLMTLTMFLNPNGVQLREKLRRRRR